MITNFILNTFQMTQKMKSSKLSETPKTLTSGLILLKTSSMHSMQNPHCGKLKALIYMFCFN